MTTTHLDLQRDMGRMEAGLEALKEAMQQGFQRNSDDIREVKDDLNEFRTDALARLSALESAESQRAGAFKLGHWLVGAVSGVVAFIAAHFLK